MKPSKSVNSLNTGASQQQQQINGNHVQPTARKPPPQPRASQQVASASNSAPTSPICRCRVMYLGSSVPHITKDGLQGIQEPLRELYPDKASLSQGNVGIDSWLSVWSNGILIENVDETGREVKRFFKIEALHYCAAVKYVPQALVGPNANGTATLPHNLAALPKFLPLDSPHARMQQDNNMNPPIFASILRRTTGVKVLECHAFICKREAAANALVRCCFHAYADTMYAKQIGADIESTKTASVGAQQEGSGARSSINQQQTTNGAPAIAARRSKSIAALNDAGDSANELTSGGEYSDSNQRQRQNQQQDFQGAVLRRRSLNNGQQNLNYATNGDISDGGLSQQQQHQAGYDSSPTTYNNLQSQKYNSKSMHQLNHAHLDQSFNNFMNQNHPDGSLSSNNQSTSYRNLAKIPGGKFDAAGEPSPLFPHNPYASRVPSYPPQSIIDQQQQQQQQLQGHNGGTLRSVKSVAANSIASTLLRSKKHAKAMSMAQLNQQQQQQQQIMNQQPVTSFHQHAANGSLYGGSFMTLPPVPPMFLPNVPRHMNGSQTMKLPSRHMLPHQMGPPMPMNFEAMTPKEMKKLLKKSAKYGIDPSKFSENGLPIMPLGPMPMGSLPPHLHQAAMFGGQPGGTFNSSIAGHDMTDLANNPFAAAPPPPPQMFMPPPEHMMDPAGVPPQPIKSILVKPNPEFLKSKAGKKWLKQQKEFKKLLPSHLDGLPIVFGPPPMEMMDPANPSNSTSTSSPMGPPPPSAFIHHPPSHLPPPPPPATSQAGLPILDSNGFYNPHPLYGPSGRTSAASTLMRNSPQIMQQHQLQQQQQFHDEQMEHHHHQMMMQQRNFHQSMYSNPMMMAGGQQQIHHPPPPPPPPPMLPPHLQAGGDDHNRSPGSSHLGHFVAPNGSLSARRRRNHMIEQSVISLGDEENEGDDDDMGHQQDEEEELYQNDGNNDQGDDGHHLTNGYGNQVDYNSSRHRHRRRRKSSSEQQQQHMTGNYQDDYEQIANIQQVPSEDLNSNSSGIYRRRGHINERAFSYSIRQEASKSSADNSDAEYRNGELSDTNYQSSNMSKMNNNINNNHIEYRLSQQQQRQAMMHYDSPQQQGEIYQNRPSVQYYRQHPSQQQQQQPVDDLAARMENQLNMKSFANSCVKSHM